VLRIGELESSPTLTGSCVRRSSNASQAWRIRIPSAGLVAAGLAGVLSFLVQESKVSGPGKDAELCGKGSFWGSAPGCAVVMFRYVSMV
jgi:hypothetical protein